MSWLAAGTIPAHVLNHWSPASCTCAARTDTLPTLQDPIQKLAVAKLRMTNT